MAQISNSFIAVGDSITFGFGVSTPWPTRLSTDLGISLVANDGHNSAGWAHDPGGGSLIARAAAEVDIYISNLPQPYLILYAGINDIFFGSTAAQAFSSFETYIKARIALGWIRSRMIVCTATSLSSISVSDKNTYNALLVSGANTYGYALARFDLDSNMGGDTSYTNPTYFQGDGVHPTDTGQQVLSNLIASVNMPAGNVRGNNRWRSR